MLASCGSHLFQVPVRPLTRDSVLGTRRDIYTFEYRWRVSNAVAMEVYNSLSDPPS
jgi:hypothetical protein